MKVGEPARLSRTPGARFHVPKQPGHGLESDVKDGRHPPSTGTGRNRPRVNSNEATENRQCRKPDRRWPKLGFNAWPGGRDAAPSIKDCPSLANCCSGG